uniref:Kinesin-like protein n=1 Tax=Callorhinchus milii TaxID=7868 RepID=A0A4W3I0B9_CALMI
MVKHTIKISARLRPTNSPTGTYSIDEEDNGNPLLEFVVPHNSADGYINNKRESYKFKFQKIFDQDAKQEDVFDIIAKPVAESALAGYNGTIFAYGQTGSGKTFTVTGGAERYSDRGIIPRILSYMFEQFQKDSSKIYTTHISYLEIYNECGYDLLDPRHEASKLEDLPKVSIMEDADQNIHLKNLSNHQATNEEESLNLLFLGDTNRMIAETPMNQASTRSHCIFTIHISSRESGSATICRSKLHLVDLAGSERVTKSGVGGQLLTEAKYINLSLSYLEQVIIALAEKNRTHIPYRNSMMTSVLRDSLGGNCMTTMIATISVEKRNMEESISTCRFAQRVALIKNEAVLNEEIDPRLMIIRLKKEIQQLKDELVMITGQQRTDNLSQEEKQKLEELIKVFLEDTDPEATLEVGADMRKIQHSFQRLKVTNATDILVSMLKKEKKKAQDAINKLNMENGELTPPNSALSSGSTPNSMSVCWYLHRVSLPLLPTEGQMSFGRQEAFEIFRTDSADSGTIDDNKLLLKQRCYKIASSFYYLHLHFCNTFLGVTSDSANITEPDQVEDKLRKQIDEEKKSYKKMFTRLKGLKTEIEHLQLLLGKAKMKMQKDFEVWWSEEATKLQVTFFSKIPYAYVTNAILYINPGHNLYPIQLCIHKEGLRAKITNKKSLHLLSLVVYTT